MPSFLFLAFFKKKFANSKLCKLNISDYVIWPQTLSCLLSLLLKEPKGGKCEFMPSQGSTFLK